VRFPPLARARFSAGAPTNPGVGGCKRDGPSSCCVLSVIIDSNSSSSPVDQRATLGSKVFDVVELCRRRRRRCYCCCCCSKLLLRGKGGDATGARRTELWVRFRRLLGLSVTTLTNHLQLPIHTSGLQILYVQEPRYWNTPKRQYEQNRLRRYAVYDAVSRSSSTNSH
jgi:hypothetical protein